jgi:hypothetical protein
MDGVKLGDIWRHKKTGNLYMVRGFSIFSCDGSLDGAQIVEYRKYQTGSTTAEFFSTPLERFKKKFEHACFEVV